MSKSSVEIAAFVGLDWADQKHALSLQEANGDVRQQLTLDQTPEALHHWIEGLRLRFGGRPVEMSPPWKSASGRFAPFS